MTACRKYLISLSISSKTSKNNKTPYKCSMRQLELSKKKGLSLVPCLMLCSLKLMKKLKSWYLTPLKTASKRKILPNITLYQSELGQADFQEYF